MNFDFLNKDRTPEERKKKAFIWNMAGSACNASITFVLTLCVTRFCGVEQCGVFSIGFAIAQLMWTIGMFEEGTYQVTDASNKLTFPQYTAFKILVCILMAVVSPFYALYMHMTLYKTYIAVLLCIFKLTDAASNLYFSLFQQHGRLDVSGFSMTVRNVVSMLVIALILLLTKSLALAIIVASALSIVWIVVFEMGFAKTLTDIKPDFNPHAMSRLFFGCLPLFLSTFLINYIYNIPKYGIEQFYDSTAQAYFNYVYSVAFIMNLFSLFALKPLQTKLTELWNTGKDEEFKYSVLKTSAAMGFISLAMAFLLAFLGPPILGWIYGVDLSIYHRSFFLVMIGGGISAVVNVLYNAITVMRLQQFLLIGYGTSAVLSVILSKYLISQSGVHGACWLFILSMALILAVFAVIFILGYKHIKLNIWKMIFGDKWDN